MTEYDVSEVKTRLKGLSEALKDSEYKNQYKGILSGLKRLTRLANHLQNGKLAHDVFDLTYFHLVNHCGTTGCALGECPTVFNQWEFKEDFNALTESTKMIPVLKTINYNDDLVMVSAIKFFNLSREQFDHLFFANSQLSKFSWKDELTNELNEEATKEEVADNMLSFILNRINIITGKLKCLI